MLPERYADQGNGEVHRLPSHGADAQADGAEDGEGVMQDYQDYRYEGYTYGPPDYEVALIDRPLAEKVICRFCKCHCEYEAWHKPGSYIALAVCPECGWTQEY